MIQRDLQPTLLRWAGVYPVVTLTGPRQSGKTTLCKAAFPDKPYVSLKPLQVAKETLVTPGNQACEPILVYGGDQQQVRNGVRICPWDHLEDLGPTLC